MPQRAATIESLPMAFEVVKEMQAGGLDWGEGYRPLGRRARCVGFVLGWAAASPDAETDRGSRMAVTIYHNPRCGKSRQTLALLRDRGIEPDVVEYLKTPPDAATLRRLLDSLGLDARGLMRRKEAAYKENGLDDAALDDDALVAAMVANPILIERPIVVTADGRAALGRPPEAVLGIL